MYGRIGRQKMLAEIYMECGSIFGKDKSMNPNHIGTNFDDFLKEEGIIMQDRFKFRIYNERIEEMLDVRLISYFSTGNICRVEAQNAVGDIKIFDDYKTSIEDIELMQCTGLKDKNGKLIYEGDIVKMNNYILQIVYNKDYACFCAENEKLLGYFRELRHIDAFEVIGNIFENKELLNDR